MSGLGAVEHVPGAGRKDGGHDAPLRIVLAVNDMGFGGAEMQVAELARRYRRRGHEVAIVVLARFLDFEEELRGHGIVTHTLGMSYGRPSARGAIRLACFLRAFRADVLHAHLLGASVMGRLARLLAPGVRVICTSHSPFERSALRYAMLRATDPLCDVWTNVCREGIDTFVAQGAVPRRKAQLTPNGIEVARHAPLNAEPRRLLRERLGMPPNFVWLAVGSFRTEQKDYDTMIEAVARVAAVRSDFEVWVAGEGALAETKHRAAVARGVGARMKFLGLRKDVPDLMRACDGFLLSSAWEAFPIVLLEASASGLPIVCTDVGDDAAIVADGETGFVVPPKSPAALAAAMVRVLELKLWERDAMGEAGRIRVAERFDIEHVVSRWIELYRHGDVGA